MNIVCAESVLAAEAAFKSVGNCIILPDNKIDRSSLLGADALIIRSKTKVDNRLLQDSNVRFIGSATAGKDHIDTRWLEENKIAWSVATGCNANSVSEYVITSLLHLAKKNSFKLKNKTIGIIGCGNVGRAVIKKSHVLGMKVLQNDPIRATEEKDFPHIPLESMLPECDIVSIHTPLTKNVAWPTENLANYEFFENLKPGAIFINTSRGEVCNYNVWLQSQNQRHLSGSIIDVWESEPNLNPDHITASSISTAHIAGHSLEGKLNGTIACYDALCSAFKIEKKWDKNLNIKEFDLLHIKLDYNNFHNEEALISHITEICYPIVKDDKKLRSTADLDDIERAIYFERIRKNYPLRREFNTFQLTIQNIPDHAEHTLSELGFKINF